MGRVLLDGVGVGGDSREVSTGREGLSKKRKQEEERSGDVKLMKAWSVGRSVFMVWLATLYNARPE